MSEDETKQDKWADWLVRGRRRGLSDPQTREMERYLNKLRDRVLRAGKVRRGQRVLDVGAGTGLLAHRATELVKDEGLVVACDISHDALAICRKDAPDGALQLVAGDACSLPFADRMFDAVVTRSVLIYLEDKLSAVRELHRVTRAGGRVSVFEPINEVWHTTIERRRRSGTYDDFQPTYDRLIDRYLRSPSSVFLGWDERDLLRWFEEAGFSDITLNYEHVIRTPAQPARVTNKARQRIRAQWLLRPNPHDPSFEELVRDELGDDAEAYLERFLEFTVRQPPATANGVAYVSARR